MIDALKTLFENDVVSEDVRAQIEEAWDAKVQENKQHAVAELREEFAQRYEHDKETMVEAVDTMISERLAEEIAEFTEDRKQLAEAKAKYARAMRENAGMLKEFVTEQLQSEIQELRQDKRALEAKHRKLEDFVVEALSKELTEFYEDKKDLAETKVKLVKESKAHLAKAKKSFIQKSAEAVTETVDAALRKEISQLHEDIETARQNDFGRKIFEAMAAEYSTSFLNERSEVAKLMKVLSAKDKQLAEAKAFAARARQLAESTTREKQKLTESVRRKEIIGDLVGPLGHDEREIMMDLLESVQTDRLQVQFNKYLPSVINENRQPRQPRKQALTESTGNRETKVKDNAGDANVIDIRRLAGLN